MAEPARVLSHAPAELTSRRLRRIGEGIGKVVYASEHWVVKRERSTSEVIALIMVWKLLSRVARVLPFHLGQRLLRRPSRFIRLLRVLIQGAMLILPRSVWFSCHVFEIWKAYRVRDRRGERLATTRLAGTTLVPERIAFPPAHVLVGGWPGWLTVDEATERVEETLYSRLARLAREERFEEVELWLDRFLEVRKAGWSRGVFSVDAHLKNFGVTEDRVVLLDAGGLTNRWEEIDRRLAAEQDADRPHVQLGLGPLLSARPEIADRFDRRWRSLVTAEGVRRHWPDSEAG